MKDLQETILKHKYLIIFLLFYILGRLILLNFNYTEWGDTFRMIRGADFLSNGVWPWDEKRWPFYSLLLVPGIWLNIPILWGRILSLIVSTGSLVLVYFFYIRYIEKREIFGLLAVILTATSSVFAYWSFRVMADVVFAFLILLYLYLFFGRYKKLGNALPNTKNFRIDLLLAVLLLALTMTRLEGAFIAASTFLFFLIKKNWKSLLIFYIPQVLIYVPWTLYAKVFYDGPVQNDYFDEVQTFVFNFDRFVYFLTYTIFILVIPVFVYFLIFGIKKLWKKRKWAVGFSVFQDPFFTVLVGFIVLELLIGFVWTPSLPRIYMPIIPFFVMLVVLGIAEFEFREKRSKLSFLISNFIFLVAFVVFQFQLRLYFLGASKVLFAAIVFTDLALISTVFMLKKWKPLLVISLGLLSILISFTIVYNQRNVYKTVKQGIEYVQDNLEGQIIAYSDETGNTEWYLRNRSFYLNINKEVDEESQYQLLKRNNIRYLLWTNEFNRGSAFVDPDYDPNKMRYKLLADFKQSIQDPFDVILDRFGIMEDKDYTVFESKIYEVL